jgi:peptidoglycan hydrolase CwlO-like protein
VICHDIMNQYKICGFKDDPSIASEYVEFLAANSGTDLLDKVAIKITSIEVEQKEIANSIKSFWSTISTVSNKLDENKKTVADLIKRLKKLEFGKH